jgi:ubiquinone/menaquinone biosynthesis C-methylase UbiE
MKEAYRVLKPGVGWIQCCEFNPRLKCDDDSVPPTSATQKVFHEMEYLIISFKIPSMKFWKRKESACFMANILKKLSAMQGSSILKPKRSGSLTVTGMEVSLVRRNPYFSTQDA